MAVNVDFSSVFHNALPMAYIRKVSLFEGELMEDRVPPSSKPQPILIETNKFGKNKVRSARRRAQLLEAGRGLTINVDLVLKDGVAKRGTSTWFEEEEAHKFLKIKVLLCRNKKASNRLLSGNLNDKEIKKLKRKGHIIEQIIGIDKQNKDPIQKYRRERFGRQRAYSVPYSVAFSIDEYRPRHLSVFAMTFLETGNSSTERQAFNSRTRSLVQGNASAEILIDNGEIQRQAFLFRTSNRQIWAGPIHYHEKRGYMAGAFHTQQEHSSLTRREVTNIVVSDYRFFEDAEKARLQLISDQPEDLEIKRRQGKRSITSETNKIPKKESYLSEAYASKGTSNTANFVFHIDFEKLIRFKGQYGKLLEISDDKAKMSILSKCRIRNVRVFRHRRQPGLRKGDARDVSYETRTEMIAIASEAKAGLLPRSVRESHPDATTTEADPRPIGAIKEIPSSAMTLRTFAVSDYDMSRRTDGLYQYSIDLDVEDGTIIFANEQLKKLSLAKKELKQFYNLSMEERNYDKVADRATLKFEREMKERYPVPRRRDIMTGRNIDRAKLVRQGISSAPWVRSVAVYADVLFNLTTINKKSSSAIADLLYEMSNPYCGHPTGTLKAIKMIESLENKIKNVLGKKQPAMDELNYSPGDSVRGSAVGRGKSSRSSIQINEQFKKLFDSDILKNVGYDFLGGSRTNGIGIRQMSAEQFNTRILLEQKKHFAGNVAEGTSKAAKAQRLAGTRESYLTPMRAVAGENFSFDLMRNAFNRKVHQNALSSILALKPDVAGRGKDKLNPNVSFASAFDSSKENDITREEVISNIMDSITLTSLGVTFLDPERHEKRRKLERDSFGKGELFGKKIEVGTMLGESVAIASDPIDDEEQASVELETRDIVQKEDLSPIASLILSQFSSAEDNLFSEPKIKSIDAFDMDGNENNIVSRFLEVRKDKTIQDVFKKMPNQIRSLFMTKAGFTNKNWISLKRDNDVDIFSDPTAMAMIYFNYQMINRIEVFRGYKKSRTTGENLLREPRFVLMTAEILRDSIEKNRNLICRMRPYSNAMLGFGHKPRLSLPIFDEHFIISPRKARNQDDDEGVLTRSLYINRIMDGTDLNDVGSQVLSKIIETSMLENVVMPEYLMTATVQQPNRATKFGTDFGATGVGKRTSTTGQSLTNVLKSISGGAATSAPDNHPQTGPTGGTTGGPGGGMTGGGGSY